MIKATVGAMVGTPKAGDGDDVECTEDMSFIVGLPLGAHLRVADQVGFKVSSTLGLVVILAVGGDEGDLVGSLLGMEGGLVEELVG